MVPDPAVCFGTLRHRRFRPVRHAFTYRVFQVLLDVDRLGWLMRVSPLAAVNRWSLATFDDRDHLGDPRQPLRDRLRVDAAKAGFELPEGPIRLLTHLRYLGYCFNPVSFFFCYDSAGTLQLVLAEVHNTFGEAEHYWLGAANVWPGSRLPRYRCPKRLHVSPFMPMELDYTFVFDISQQGLVVHMNTLSGGVPFFDATLRLTAVPWSASALHRALARHPWMTAKVIGAIHWQALRLWWKGAPVYPNPGRGYRRLAPEVGGEEA